jgi:hypothetical protein
VAAQLQQSGPAADWRQPLRDQLQELLEAEACLSCCDDGDSSSTAVPGVAAATLHQLKQELARQVHATLQQHSHADKAQQTPGRDTLFTDLHAAEQAKAAAQRLLHEVQAAAARQQEQHELEVSTLQRGSGSASRAQTRAPTSLEAHAVTHPRTSTPGVLSAPPPRPAQIKGYREAAEQAASLAEAAVLRARTAEQQLHEQVARTLRVGQELQRARHQLQQVQSCVLQPLLQRHQQRPQGPAGSTAGSGCSTQHHKQAVMLHEQDVQAAAATVQQLLQQERDCGSIAQQLEQAQEQVRLLAEEVTATGARAADAMQRTACLEQELLQAAADTR